MLAPPEQLAVNNKARHPENADRLRCAANPIELPLPSRAE